MISASDYAHQLLGGCHHRQNIGKTNAVLYCLALATAFVGCLYLLVPSATRCLDRNHPRQIQWRTFATVTVSLCAIVSYPFLFCAPPDLSGGFTVVGTLTQMQGVVGVLVHTMILYLGPNVSALLDIYQERQYFYRTGNQPAISYPTAVFKQLILPTFQCLFQPRSSDEFWKSARNYIVAPWTEEVVFRGCMVPVLLASPMSSTQVVWVAPLFFGVAHVHHAATQLSKGERPKTVLIMTAFQFVYTSLFGSYAAHAFLRTGSIAAVFVSHCYCNMMGLPSLGFLNRRHRLYRFRIPIVVAFLIGIVGFQQCFSRNWLLPLPAVLPKLVVDHAAAMS